MNLFYHFFRFNSYSSEKVLPNILLGFLRFLESNPKLLWNNTYVFWNFNYWFYADILRDYTLDKIPYEPIGNDRVSCIISWTKYFFWFLWKSETLLPGKWRKNEDELTSVVYNIMITAWAKSSSIAPTLRANKFFIRIFRLVKYSVVNHIFLLTYI